MKIVFNQVTWYSKLLALVLIPITFYLGMYFGKIYTLYKIESQPNQIEIKKVEKQPTAIEMTSKKILGTWKRDEIPSQEVKYLSDVAEVYYDGKLNTTFRWEIVDQVKNYQFNPGDLIVKEFDSKVDRYYLIKELTDQKLTLHYLATKVDLHYTKVE